MTPKQIRQLRSLLLECATMQQRARRDAVVAKLPEEIGANINRYDADQFDIINILDSCLSYDNGFVELINCLYFLEGDTVAMQAVLRFQTEFLGQEPSPIANERVWPKDDKVMVRVPAGEFLYGEKQAKMYLPEFWIDKTPVTNAEYARFFMETERNIPPPHWNGNTPLPQITTHPIVNVSRDDAEAYALWAGKQLPPEQYWEKAARGTDGRIYPWGNHEPTVKLCNFNQGLAKLLWQLVVAKYNTYNTTPVGQYSPQGDSPFGCVDMAGNVYEWTASFTVGGDMNILCGGSWSQGAAHLRCATRGVNYRNKGFNESIGFRCVYLPNF